MTERRALFAILVAWPLAALAAIGWVSAGLPRLCLTWNLFHLPCPGCGLTRAVATLLRLEVVGAVRHNFLVIPLALGAATSFFCALIQLRTGAPWFERFRAMLGRREVIATAAALAIASGVHNLCRIPN